MSWRDELAVKLVSTNFRLRLINELDMELFMDRISHLLSVHEWERIMVHTMRTARSKTFIDILCGKLNSQNFFTFLTALQCHPSLKEEIVRAYENEGGQVGPRVDYDAGHKDCLCNVCMEKAKRRRLLLLQ